MTAELKTVRLYGKLGTRFGRVFRLAVNSPAEAVRALSMQLPGFEAYFMQAHKRGVQFAVFNGKHNLTKDELTHPPGDDDIRIAPVLTGSKRGGILNIVLGVALIAVGFMIPGTTPFMTKLGIAVIGAGVSMAIGGVIQLLSPGPRGIGAEDRPENRASHNFNGPVNTTAQGNPVPVLYGRHIVGSAVISAGIIANDEVYVPTDDGRGGGGGGGGGSPPWHLDWVQQVQ